MVKLRFPLLFLVILISCEKKVQETLLSENGPKLTDVRSSNASLNQVITPPVPPASISNDLTIAGPGGTSITVITASEYNALNPMDQIYYTGFRNAVQYLFQNPANQSANMVFNGDGSYSISINSDLDDDPPSGGTCKVCSVVSAYKCKNQISKYMHDNGLTKVTLTIENSSDAGCMNVSYRNGQFLDPVVDMGGTLVETNPPPGIFSNFDFDSYILTVKLWGSNQAGGGPITHPGLWTRDELVGYIKVFNDDLSHAPIGHQNESDFQTQLMYYVYYTMP
jgi:hypothetical protein